MQDVLLRHLCQKRHSIKLGPNIAVDESWAKLTFNIHEIQRASQHTSSPLKSATGLAQMLYNGVSDLVVENLNRLAEEIILFFQPSLPDSSKILQEGETLKGYIKYGAIIQIVWTS
ncbi:hypothetical protein BJV78DRAFT_602723 [Lactifluus subvellereus]|nr:hypothetical protein BJV78DRAFT_602723 [Lactifluus subvellereus]